jgi:pyrimidine operon attenuation protein / uracil phosphoribosyltransferase
LRSYPVFSSSAPSADGVRLKKHWFGSTRKFGNDLGLLYQLSTINYQLFLMSSSIVEILSADEIRRTIVRLASEINERCGDLAQVVLVGIQTKGVPLANMLAKQIEILEGIKVPVAALDITFYRDDLDLIAVRTPGKTEIPVDLNDKTVILVDDVIYEGRTIRAAMNAVNEYGRPKYILLTVLIDRGHRQVPIHPDFIGKKLPTSRDEKVKVYFQESDGRAAVELTRAVS